MVKGSNPKKKKKDDYQPGKSLWVIDANGNKVKNPVITDAELSTGISDMKQSTSISC